MSHPLSNRSVEPVLIAGLGSIGRRHLENLRALGCSQFVFYRTHQSTIGDIDLASWPVTTDWDEAVAKKPRAAIISNPTSKHLDLALSAAQAGCHLFIEKPLSHTLDGCRELAEIVRKNKLTTMIGCQFRFHPLLVSLRRQLRAGRVGEVLGAHAQWGEYLPDWHPWEDHRRSYSARADLGGGVILTLIHPLDYLIWLLGPVAHAQASVRRVPSLQTAAEDDWAEMTLRFASGAIGQVHLDYVQKPAIHQLRVWGDLGRATWDYHAGTLLWEDLDDSRQTETVPAGFERNTMFVDEMREFLAAVQGGKPTSIPLEEGIAVLEVALAAKKSARQESCCG
jgi:predicted dehydrogenase